MLPGCIALTRHVYNIHASLGADRGDGAHPLERRDLRP